MPIGAYGGKAEIMNCLKPLGEVYQAGTFSGNPVTMAGGVATLDLLSDPSVYDLLEKQTARLFAGFQNALSDLGRRLEYEIPVRLQRVGSMFAIMFTDIDVKNFDDSKTIDESRFATFFHEFLSRGMMLPPTAVDAACVSVAHSDDDIDLTVAAFHESIEQTFCR